MITFGTGQGDHYANGCLIDYFYFKEYYKMIATGLSNQKELDDDPKAIQQISFTRNLDVNVTTFLTIQEVKETILDFSQVTVRVLSIYFALNVISI